MSDLGDDRYILSPLLDSVIYKKICLRQRGGWKREVLVTVLCFDFTPRPNQW